MSKSGKLDYVDALRGLAILAVVLVHCDQYGTNDHPTVLHSIFANGAMGVQLFYVMSAFTLFLSCDRRGDRELHPNRNFFVRRFFRIAPMYWLGIGYYLWQNGRGPSFWLGDAPGISDGNILANIFFVHGVNPYWINSLVPGGWSIAVEMVFYLLIPLLFTWIKDLNGAVKAFLIVLILRLVLHAILITNPMIGDIGLWRQFLFFYLPNQLPVFMVGFMLFFILRGGEGDRRVAPGLLIGFGLLFILHLATMRQILVPTHVLFAFGFLVLALGLARYPVKWIVNAPIRHIGKVSYSMYLSHFAVLHWLQEFGLADPIAPTSTLLGVVNYAVRYGMVVAVAVALSTVLYHVVEMPAMDLGKRLIKRWEAKPVPVPRAAAGGL